MVSVILELRVYWGDTLKSNNCINKCKIINSHKKNERKIQDVIKEL